MVILAVLLYCLVPSGCPIGHIVYLWTLTVEITGFYVARKEGFEPSRRFYPAYSLSRGAPSASWVLPQVDGVL